MHLLTGRFGWFFVGRTVDLAGSSMTTVALALAVLQASGGMTDLGVVLAANLVPTLVLLLVGGAVADRVSRRTVLIVTNLATAVVMAAMAVVLITGSYDLVVIACLAFAGGAVSAFSQPALRGIVPELVERRDLQRANALLSGSQNTARILGPVVAGVLVATVGGGWALAVDAASYLLAAAAFTRIPGTTRAPAAHRPLWRDLADGWAVFRSMRWVVVMTVSFALVNAFSVGPWNVLGPQVVSGHDGAVGWGTVQTVRAAGLLLMSVVAVRLVLRRPLRDGRLWGALGGLPLLALGLSGETWLVAAAAFVGGLGFTVAAITWESTLQAAVPGESLSRVAAYDDLLSYVTIPLSQLAVGPLAASHGAKEVSVVCGIAFTVVCLLPLLNRDIRADRIVPKQAPAA
ncbi:MFS transporter [Actinophytocola algeriensis]|uniref:MFS family permease n=1 Tax=Actinophytocola algeriensis TaxID=1768010 RepID=A0A7W7QCM6_9PSEU|nr:MFS transporter [Actinophytocola algeriensis]MBB4911058.1 MFS family permease [Actinophytocola algeriensis]MBE1474051.1 MFS family permease [Actinophytocola algeriensis]